MKKVIALFLILTYLSSCSENHEEKAERIKLNFDNLMQCESYSITFQEIQYLDSLNQTHSENAYAVMDNGKLIYFTSRDFKAVLMEQIVSYRDIKLLRFQGREPQTTEVFLKGLNR